MEHSEAYQMGRMVGVALICLLVVGGVGFFTFALVKAFTRKTAGWIVTAAATAALGLLAVVGIVAVGFGFALKRVNKELNSTKVATSQDGRYSITVPGRWKPMPELNEDACIETGNQIWDQYAIVIVQEKEDLGISLEDFADMLATEFRKSMRDTSEATPDSLVIGSCPALRYRISGKVNGIDVVYHHTCLETPKALCQILCWSKKSDEKAAKPIFDQVAASFVAKEE